MKDYNEDSPAVKFLNEFEHAQRSGIAQLFYTAVRSGANDAAGVIESVRGSIQRRDVRDAARRGFVRLIPHLDTSEARAFAQYVIERESLPAEEKAVLKIENRKRYQREYLKAQKPTIKQLNYLRNLGCAVVPQNMLEASELIDTWRTRGRIWP